MTRWYQTAPSEAKSPIKRYQELPVFILRHKPFVSLNQQVQGSSPWRLTLDTELPSNDMRHITRRQPVDKKLWDEPSWIGDIILASR